MSYSKRQYRPKSAHWLTTKFDGRCHVCGSVVGAGSRAFWDPDTQAITCDTIACAKADGLTRTEWFGSPVSGSWVDVLAATRIGG